MSLKKTWRDLAKESQKKTAKTVEQKRDEELLFYAVIGLILFPTLFTWSHVLLGKPAVMDSFRTACAITMELMGIASAVLYLKFKVEK